MSSIRFSSQWRIHGLIRVDTPMLKATPPRESARATQSRINLSAACRIWFRLARAIFVSSSIMMAWKKHKPRSDQIIRYTRHPLSVQRWDNRLHCAPLSAATSATRSISHPASSTSFHLHKPYWCGRCT